MDPELTPQRVIEELEQEGLDEEQGTAVWHRVWHETPMRSLVGALRIAEDPDTRRALLDLLGFRSARSAIPDIIAHLDDSDVDVRAAAAKALGKAFGHIDRPPPSTRVVDGLAALLHRWEFEPDDDLRSILVGSLALVGDPSVRPLLIGAQNHADEKVRGRAQWGLGYLNGLEKEGYSRRRFAWAHTPPPGWDKHDDTSTNGQSPG